MVPSCSAIDNSDLRSFLEAWRDGDLPALEGDEPLPRPNPELFGAYVDDLLNLPIDRLGRRPPGLVDLLTEVALGSPAILALRSLDASPDLAANTRRRLAVTIADAFWSLFNQPAVISLMRQLSAGKKASRDDTAYWRLVCQRRSKKRPPWRSKKGPLGGCGLVPVVHGRAPRATRRALNRLTRRCARGGPVGPRGQARAGWSVQFAVGV